MNKEILTFGVLKLKKIHFTTIRLNKDVDNEKVLLSNKISLVKKTISSLLVTCVIIIKLNHYI